MNMPLSRLLLIVALLLAFVLTVLGFDWLHTNGDPHLFGWAGATLFAFIASHLVP